MNYNIPHVIYIATKNPDKFKSIRRAFQLITKDIKIIGIDPSLPECKETGKNSRENALLKAKHYFNFTKDNTLAEDDSIYFNDLSHDKQPKHLAKTFVEKNVKDQNYWKNFLNKHDLKTGKIVKYFCYISKDKKTKYLLINIPFRVTNSTKIKNSKNFINNFIIPKGFNKTLSQMNQAERNEFSLKYIAPILTKIINV